MNKIILLLITSLLFSCKETKQVTDKEVKENQNRIEKHLKDGYKIGSFIINKNTEGCNYLIKDKESLQVLDPVNLNDEKYSNYKNINSDFFFKYLPLKRVSRCDNTQPIELTDFVIL